MRLLSRYFKCLLGLGLFFLLVAGGVLYFLSDLLSDIGTQIPPAARPAITPSRIGLAFETVNLHTRDGLNLDGWWFPKGSDSGKPAVLVLHGFGAAKEHMINYMLLAQQHGYPAMAIDFRGHGDSDPSLCSFGFHEQKDVQRALDFLAEKGQKRVCLWGTSMGAVTAILTAAKHPPQVCGVIADAPFDTLHNSIVHHARLFYGLPEFPLVTLTFPRIEQKAHYHIRDVNPAAALSQVQVPIFFLAAQNDQRMPVPLVRSLYEKAAEPKKWYVIPGVGHEFRRFEPEFQQQIVSFLDTLK